MEEVRKQTHVAAPPEAVFAVFTDHVGYTRWAGVKEVVLRQQGEPPPNGLGTLRVIRANGLAIEEEVTAFEPPSFFQYRMVAGLPVRDYVNDVRFEPSGDGTDLSLHIRFEPRIPFTGGLLRRLIDGSMDQLLERLKRVDFAPAAERTTA